MTNKVKAEETATTKTTSGKTKSFSGKVTPETFELFTRINRACGLSNNSALNMIMSEYVRRNKHILDE